MEELHPENDQAKNQESISFVGTQSENKGKYHPSKLMSMFEVEKEIIRSEVNNPLTEESLDVEKNKVDLIQISDLNQERSAEETQYKIDRPLMHEVQISFYPKHTIILW